MLKLGTMAALVVLGAACTDNPGDVDDRCMATMLPLTGAASGPTVTDVGLEIQASNIVVVATATDPQGSANLEDVVQSVGVFRDMECTGSPIVVQDDVVGSGIEETFGTVVESATDRALYEAISTAQRWPVEVDVKDRDANRTAGRVLARIIR